MFQIKTCILMKFKETILLIVSFIYLILAKWYSMKFLSIFLCPKHTFQYVAQLNNTVYRHMLQIVTLQICNLDIYNLHIYTYLPFVDTPVVVVSLFHW